MEGLYIAFKPFRRIVYVMSFDAANILILIIHWEDWAINNLLTDNTIL